MPKYTQSLQDYVNTKKAEKSPLKAGEILIIIEQLMNSLELLHRVGYCHNDIKPSNIMLDSNMDVVLIDLGFTTKFMETNT